MPLPPSLVPKGTPCYLLPLEGVFILLHTQFVHRYVVLILFLYILPDRRLIQPYRTYILPFSPKVPVSIFVL
jgi:hypothetical protein